MDAQETSETTQTLSSFAERGVALAKEGQFQEALALLGATEGSSAWEPQLWLSVSLRGVGRYEEALAMASKVATLAPGSGAALTNLGVCQMAVSDLQAAAASFYRAAELQPLASEAYYNLGVVLAMLGSPEANEFYERAIRAVKGSASGLAALGDALLSQGLPDKAWRCSQEALALEPSNVAAHNLAARTGIQLGKADEALDHGRRAVDLDPANPFAQYAMALALQAKGQTSDAINHFRRSIELKPSQGLPYAAIAFNQKRESANLDFRAAMESVVGAPDLPLADAEMLHYGLGHTYEQSRSFEVAMAHYREANRLAKHLKFGNTPFHRAPYAGQIRYIKEVFDKELLERFKDVGPKSSMPIFVVGMIRSGTTLMEQILSSHQEVVGAGELTFWLENAQRALDGSCKSLDVAATRTVANRYLELLASLAPDAGRVVDKMPANLDFLGLIQVALPNARIIHLRRNGADTCFSIYATPNAARAPFLHDLGNISFAYRGYLDLSSHWRAVLDKRRYMEVGYEELVQNQEAITRQVLQFCGLEWNERCLAPEKNPRAISTPSLWQARQPVYNTSAGRWRNFEAWTPEFKAFNRLEL